MTELPELEELFLAAKLVLVRARTRVPAIKREHVLLYRHDLRDTQRDPDAAIAPLDRDELPWLREVWEVDADEMRRRHDSGQICYGAFVEDRLAHYSWVQPGGTHEISDVRRSFPVGPRERWIYHCRTADWARGRGLYTATLRAIIADGAQRGDERAWIYTNMENTASQGGITRAGFVRDVDMRALRIGRFVMRLG